MNPVKPLRSAALFGALLLASNAFAQFSGPSVTGRSVSVQQARDARLGSYVTVTGHIVNHLRGDDYTFRDASGDIRVEIADSVWQNRKVEPATKVRLLAEVDSGFAGRYLYVKSLDVLD